MRSVFGANPNPEDKSWCLVRPEDSLDLKGFAAEVYHFKGLSFLLRHVFVAEASLATTKQSPYE